VSGRLCDALVDRFGSDFVFKDVDSIPAGVDYRRYLETGVQQCDVMLAVVGRDWMSIDPVTQRRRIDDAGDFVRIEIEAALKRDILLIPVLVRGAKMPEAAALPAAIRDF